MNIKSSTMLTILLVLSWISFSQKGVTVSREFVETIPPKIGSPAWFVLNYSKNEFGVKNAGGKLEIRKVKESN